MPKKRQDSRSDDSSSYSSGGESSDSSARKRHDHRRSKKDSVPKHPPSRDVKYRDQRHRKESSSLQRQTTSSRHHSSDSSRRHSPFQEKKRVDEKSDTRRRGEKDRQDQNSVSRRDRDVNQKRVAENMDRIESRHRSRDDGTEKSRRAEEKRHTSHSKDKDRSKGGKEDDNYSNQQTDKKGKEKNLASETRRVRNDDKDSMLLNPTQKTNTKDSLKEKKEERSGLLSDNSKTSDRSQKDEKRVAQEAKKIKQSEKEILRKRKRKISDSSSSASSEEHSSSESDSDIASPDAAKKGKIMKASKEPTVFQSKRPETGELVDHPVESEKGKVSVIEKKIENLRKDVDERNHESRSSGSDSSEDESERKTSKHSQEHIQTKENMKRETYKRPNTEDENKAVTTERQRSLSQEKLSASRDVDSAEEKEEGEISEDNEDKISDKPLQAISNYVSDISSDEGQSEANQTKEVQQQQTAPFPQSSQMTTRIPSDATKKIEENVEQLGKSSKAGKTDKKTVAALNEDVSGPGTGSSKIRKKIHNFSDSEVVDGEDNSKRQRPVLESESDDEDNGRDAGKSHVQSNNQSKLKMGSFVSVVKQQSDRRDRDSSVDRERSRRRGREDGRSRDKGDRGTRLRQDAEKERKERKGEAKESSDKNEQKTTPVIKPAAKPDSTNAPKTTEDSVKKPVTAFDITTRTGGAYIPPAKLRMMQELITDKTSVAYQRMSWEALKKSINGLINKVNVSNIINIIKELFQENIVRGRGLLARSVIQAQAASQTFTHVYAALVAIINTKFPQNGELILRRLILMFRRGYKRNDKALCLSSTTFIAHLVNQQVAHEVLALEILTLLLENPTDDSTEIAIGFLKECGHKLTEVSPRGINSIFERLRNILHEGQLDARVQYMVEVMFAIRKDGFKDHPSVMPDLDLVQEDEQFTHLLQLEDAVTGDEMLNVFKADPTFAENEEKYKALKKEILDEGSSDEGSDDESGSGSSESDDEETANAEKQTIIDKTETNLIALRRNIYLTIQSSLDHNECAHKILKMDMKPGQEIELCNMILDCCAQLRTYEKFFGLLAQRFCQLDRKYIEPFQQIFLEQYETIHRLETDKLRNVAKFFSHLLHTDAISWGVLSVIKLTEEDTSSASRIFLKIMFQELSEYMGLLKLNERLKDPTLAPYFAGIMARDNPKNTRFCINFFTTIGLGGLTDDLREHLKSATKQIAQQNEKADLAGIEDSSSSSDSSSDSSDSDTSSDSGSDTPSKGKHKSSASKTKKTTEKESSKSKKKVTDKENKRTSRLTQRSSDRDSKSESRSKSSGKGGMDKRNVSPDKSRRTIADRLLDMAQYGNIRNGDERTKETNEKDRREREKEVRPNINRMDAGDGRKGGRDDREYVDKNVGNEERWGQSGKRWNSFDERGDKRQEENMGYGNRSGEDRRQRVEDERRWGGGRQNQMKSFRRREDDSYQQNDNSWERRLEMGSGNNRRLGNDYNRDDFRQDKGYDADKGKLVHRGEKRKDRRHDSSSEESDSSRDKGKKKSDKGRKVSISPESKSRKRSLDAESAPKQGNKRQHRHETSDVDSSSDSNDDSDGKLSKSRKEGRDIQASKSRSDLSQTKKRKKSLSSSGSQSSSSSSSSSDEEAVQERRIITKKPRLVGDKNLKRQNVLEERSSDKDRDRRRK